MPELRTIPSCTPLSTRSAAPASSCERTADAGSGRYRYRQHLRPQGPAEAGTAAAGGRAAVLGLRLVRVARLAGGGCPPTARQPPAGSPMRRPPTTRTGRPSRACASAAQNAGHRNRLRQRFLEAGAEALPDYELLELLLFFSIDVKDTKPLAKELLARYGSLGAILKASPASSPSSTTCARSTPRSRRLSRLPALRRLPARPRAAPDQLSEAARRWRAYEQDDEGRWEIVRLAAARDRDPAQGGSASCSSGCCARRSRTGR